MNFQKHICFLASIAASILLSACLRTPIHSKMFGSYLVNTQESNDSILLLSTEIWSGEDGFTKRLFLYPKSKMEDSTNQKIILVKQWQTPVEVKLSYYNWQYNPYGGSSSWYEAEIRGVEKPIILVPDNFSLDSRP